MSASSEKITPHLVVVAHERCEEASNTGGSDWPGKNWRHTILCAMSGHPPADRLAAQEEMVILVPCNPPEEELLCHPAVCVFAKNMTPQTHPPGDCN